LCPAKMLRSFCGRARGPNRGGLYGRCPPSCGPPRRPRHRLASTIARMPARTAGGRLDHASTTTARSRSAGLSMGTFMGTSPESAFSSGFSGLDAGLQIRHRRFDSDRSLSALDPCEVPELPVFAGVFAFLGPSLSGPPTARKVAPECQSEPLRAGAASHQLPRPLLPHRAGSLGRCGNCRGRPAPATQGLGRFETARPEMPKAPWGTRGLSNLRRAWHRPVSEIATVSRGLESLFRGSQLLSAIRSGLSSAAC